MPEILHGLIEMRLGANTKVMPVRPRKVEPSEEENNEMSKITPRYASNILLPCS